MIKIITIVVMAGLTVMVSAIVSDLKKTLKRGGPK